MSHELRTPLNGIIGLSDALLIGCCGDLTEMTIKTISTIKNSGLRLLGLINEILDSTSMKQASLSRVQSWVCGLHAHTSGKSDRDGVPCAALAGQLGDSARPREAGQAGG